MNVSVLNQAAPCGCQHCRRIGKRCSNIDNSVQTDVIIKLLGSMLECGASAPTGPDAKGPVLASTEESNNYSRNKMQQKCLTMK